MVTTVKK